MDSLVWICLQNLANPLLALMDGFAGIGDQLPSWLWIKPQVYTLIATVTQVSTLFATVTQVSTLLAIVIKILKWRHTLGIL